MKRNERLLYIVAILVFALGCFYYRTSLQKAQEDLEINKVENARMVTYIENQGFDLETAKREINLLKDKNFKKYQMYPLKKKSTKLATSLYHSSENGQVYLIVNTPSPLERDKQYHLWAIYKGQFIDAGHFETGLTGLQKLKTIPHADSFTITVEPMGSKLGPSTPPIVQTEALL